MNTFPEADVRRQCLIVQEILQQNSAKVFKEMSLLSYPTFFFFSTRFKRMFDAKSRTRL